MTVSTVKQEPALEARLTGNTVFVPAVVLGELYFGAYRAGQITENLARAAVARQHNLTLVTRDQHFGAVEGLPVETW